MKVRRFRAKSYADALRQVKESLGDEAVILESRKIRAGAPEGSAGKADGRNRWGRWLGMRGGDGAEPEGQAAVVAVEITAAVGEGAESLVDEGGGALIEAPPPAPALPEVDAGPPPPHAPPIRSHTLRQVEAQLLSEEVDFGLAAELADGVLAQLEADELEDEGRILDLTVAELYARIDSLPPGGRPQPGSTGPRIQVLVGPAGLGKTTTVAKLAAAGSLRRDEKIALITLGDPQTDRRPELARVAKVLQAPYEVCRDTDALMTALAPLGGCDRILVDTPSASPFDEASITELGHTLSAMPNREVHLVLSPALRDRDLRAAVEGYAPLELTALIFTHLDEAASYGGMLNACSGAQLPISWLAFGPRVPDDIEIATAERLIDLLLDLSGRLDEEG